MADDGGKQSAKSLVQSLLAGAKLPGTEPGAAAPSLPHEAQTAAREAASATAQSLPEIFDMPGETAQQQAPKASAQQVSALISKLSRGAAPSQSGSSGGTAPTQGIAAQEPLEGAEGALEEEATLLIEIYFDAEEPDERDIAFDRLVQIHIPMVDDFLLAVLEQDEDEYTRALAASELARRQKSQGTDYLESHLHDPLEPFFFEQAVMVLGEVQGPAFYDTLEAIWRDTERDDDERRESMVGMEMVDPPRALRDFALFIDTLEDIKNMPDDQVEQAIMAFVRHGITAAITNLQALRERVQTASIEPSEKEELWDFISAGISLLQAPPES